MAIFADNEPPVRRRRRGGGWIGWGLSALAIVALVVVALSPSPYVVEKPGPVFNTLGTTTVNGAEAQLIDIPSQKTYPTEGSLDMLTVSISGSRDTPLSWLDTAMAWLTPSDAVVPVDDIYPAGVTVEQSNQQGATEMKNSQQEAIAAALRKLGYTFTSTLTVNEVVAGTPAENLIAVGDVVTSVNGTPFGDVSALKALIAANGAGKPAAIGVTRAGKAMTINVTPVIQSGSTAPVIGVVLESAYAFPFAVDIQLDNVGGPSAGQMFALGIIDKLTEGSLNGGNAIAGTGTITAAGDVGAIGGIRQKMYGAKQAGAKYFLAPASNCDEVVGHIPDGLTVFAVNTLDQSLAALAAVSTGASTAALPNCSN